MDDADAAIAAEQQQVKNPFPTPPQYWTRYTPENIRLLGRLKSKIKERKENVIIEESSTTEESEVIDQAALLLDEESLPAFPLLELEPPRLDWILEQETYSTFGEIHPTKEQEQELPPGVPKLYDGEPGSDLRPYLRQMLLSLLAAYHKLLSDILEPVPSGYNRPPDPSQSHNNPTGQDPLNEDIAPPEWPPPLNWEATVLWIRTLGMNMGWAINEYRPIQARLRLEAMMQRQIETRREETRMVHAKCDELEKTLAELRNQTKLLLPGKDKEGPTMDKADATSINEVPTDELDQRVEEDLEISDMAVSREARVPDLSIDDLLEWSEEVNP